MAAILAAAVPGRAQHKPLPRRLRAVNTEAKEPSPSVSRGMPWDGELQNGVELRESDTLRYVGQYVRGGNFFGTSELVGMLERTAAAVAKQWAGSRLSVGELSAEAGGWIEGHHSHRSGRDADLAFFMRNDVGHFARFWRFVAFGRSGPAAPSDGRLRFDDSRNWAAVAHMLRDPDTRIQYIFVSNPIRARLLVEGKRRGESEEFLRAAAAVMVEPQKGHKHENHFHVRIFCPRDDRPHCEDASPYWPWFEGASPDGTYAELPLIRWRAPQAQAHVEGDADSPEARQTKRPRDRESDDAARQAAGEGHRWARHSGSSSSGAEDRDPG